MSKKAFSQALEERRATFTTQSTHKKRKSGGFYILGIGPAKDGINYCPA
jgi:hypothetical protein